MLPAVAGRSLKFWLLVAVVLATTLQPILHNHSLIPDATDQHYSSSASLYCPLCAIGADRETFAPPAIGAPVTVQYELPTYDAVVVVQELARPSASRAPPAA